ncbi:MAG TPA: c-type cytochrome [Candidatus Dormibacteraeota bacterium]|nr:c-type cytochrome [Candidatus Dormibacteraeota bacterium]
MKKFAKILLGVLAALVVLAAVGISLTIGWRPFLGPSTRALTSRKFASTPQRLARGAYLVNDVADCMGCHSPHDWTAHDAPVLPGMLGAGQDMSFLKGLPGKVVAPNITPDPETGAGNWTDDQLARAIREGIGHDGRALFSFMPFEFFRSMSDEDLASVVVYLRSLPAVHNPLPPTELVFPVKYLIRSVPKPLDAPVPEPDLSTPEKRGKYLVTIAHCADCHTPQDAHGQPLPGMAFAGGLNLDGPWGRVASANIRPGPTGIDGAIFMQALLTGYVGQRKLNQIMPWHAYRNMTSEDLASMLAYLQTLKPVKHFVDNTLPPTYCKVCRQMHGGGDRN